MKSSSRNSFQKHWRYGLPAAFLSVQCRSMAVKKKDCTGTACGDLGIGQLIFRIGVVMRECRTFFVVQTPDIGHIVSRPGFSSIAAPGRSVETARLDSTIGFPFASAGKESVVDADNRDFTGSHTVATAVIPGRWISRVGHKRG